MAGGVYSTDLAETPTCVDLFSGAGGLSLGFCQAGGLPVAAVDSDRDSTETYSQMFADSVQVHCCDIEEWDPGSLRHRVDVVIGGPPCQGFSLARGLRFVDDPRNHLYREFIRIVQVLEPEWVVMENVPGITNIGKGEVLDEVYEDFGRAGYALSHRVVNMAEYGVPQIRKRAIFVGHRHGREFQWPPPICVPRPSDPHAQGSLLADRPPYVSVREALDDLPWPMGRWFAHRANSQMRGPRNRDVDSKPAFTLRVRGDEFAICEEPAKAAFAPGPVPDVSLSTGRPRTRFRLL